MMWGMNSVVLVTHIVLWLYMPTVLRCVGALPDSPGSGGRAEFEASNRRL